MQFKMAGKKTISMELYNAIKSKDYCDFVNYLGPKDGLGIAAFLNSTCGQLYTADTSLLHRNGRRTNNNHIYQMFGEFSGMDSEEVKMAMLKEITNNYDFYERKCIAILHKLDMNLSHWLGRHLKKNVRADVLAIFVLSVMYDRHTVIHTNSMPWCTKKFHNREGEGTLFSSCHIHLLGVGDDMYIILRPKPSSSILQSTSQSMIPGGSMEIFTSNTETHVEYTFELPKQTENIVGNDCEVMDYYPPVPQNNELSNDYQTVNPQQSEVDVISSDSGPCERLSDGFEEYCELQMNTANTEQVNNTVLDIRNNVTSNNDTVPINLPVDSDRTVSLNSSIRLSDLDQTPSEQSVVDDKGDLNMDVSDCNSDMINKYVTSTNSMDIDPDIDPDLSNHPDNNESDISTSDNEELLPSETSVSHTETDCSVNENIIRIKNDIVIEMTNRTCHLILPKLPDETINYWKSRTTHENPSQISPPTNDSDNRKDPIKVDDVPTIIENITDQADQKYPSQAKPSLNTTASSGHNTSGSNDDTPSLVNASSGQNTPKRDDNKIDITQSSVKTSSGQNTPPTIDNVLPHKPASSGQNNTGNTSVDSNGSLSESLLKPVLTRSNRRASMKKYVNFKHMCNSNSSSDAEPTIKPLKPLPGHSPSSSRLRAQELINKHRIPKSECDTDGYSGDTEDCTDSENNSKHDEEHTSNVSCSNMKLKSPNTNLDPPKPTISEEPNKSIKSKRKILTKTKTKGGQLNIELKGILKRKKIRKSTCPKCKFSGFSTKELNEHYRKTHQPIPCTICFKTFNNPSSHRRHMYIHTKVSNTFSCHRCSKTFPFESQLRSHKDIHRRLSNFACFAAGCKKVFRREASLIAHVQQHNGPLIKCDQCEYTCRDQRYLTQHYRTHTGAKPYDCKNCAKKFTFYEQWKRHSCAHSDEY